MTAIDYRELYTGPEPCQYPQPSAKQLALPLPQPAPPHPPIAVEVIDVSPVEEPENPTALDMTPVIKFAVAAGVVLAYLTTLL